MAHSIDEHAGDGAIAEDSADLTDGPAGESTAGIDGETAEQLLRLLEQRNVSSDLLLVQYGQRFLLVAGLTVLLMALLLSYLHLTGIIGTSVFMFSLGTLFGVALSYLQGFIQSFRR